MDRCDLTGKQWTRHAIEEQVDGLKYMIRVEDAMELLEHARDMLGRIRLGAPVDLSMITAWVTEYDKKHGS